jgi:hypothetical protein
MDVLHLKQRITIAPKGEWDRLDGHVVDWNYFLTSEQLLTFQVTETALGEPFLIHVPMHNILAVTHYQDD